MTEQKSQEKVTINLAAKALNVGRRTIYRWIDKGLLTKIKEGNKTFILMDDVRALRDKTMAHVNWHSDTEKHANSATDNNNVTVSRMHYDGLLTRLGQLEVKQQLLLEYQAGLAQKDKELSQAKENLSAKTDEISEIKINLSIKNQKIEESQKRIQELENQNKYLKSRSLLQRILNKF